MGQKNGYWFGREIEKTQHYGLETIFFSRFHALEHNVKQPHIFIALIDPLFFSNTLHDLEITMMYAEALLQQGKCVTFEVNPEQSLRWAKYFTPLREKYTGLFVLLIVLEVPQLELGAFSVKVVPSTLFQDIENERCVATIPSQMLLDYFGLAPGTRINGKEVYQWGKTYWHEYEADKDGE
jgi:hypothetical protein